VDGQEIGGDKYLVEWIERFAPDLVLSGHIHAPFYPDGSWIDRIGKTWVLILAVKSVRDRPQLWSIWTP
jgi:Icc-related predicted phosphoesterase